MQNLHWKRSSTRNLRSCTVSRVNPTAWRSSMRPSTLSTRAGRPCASRAGGIRSATFSLGVIQGLARAGWLKRFHYLSTVSGGGYIGGWLSAWIHSSNLDSVVADLCPHKAPSVTVPPSGSAVSPESKHIRWLRALSNYLSPRIGFSADFWTLIAVVLRNLLLHWVVFIPLLAAALMLP